MNKTKIIFALLFFYTAHFIPKEMHAQNWNQISKLTPLDRDSNEEFGVSVAIEGEYAVVGVSKEDEDENNSNPVIDAGAVYIFKKNNGIWTQIQKIVASERNEADFFGTSVSISGDYIIVGAVGEDEDESGSNSFGTAGAAYIFNNQNGTWVETQKIVASDRESAALFGTSVSISGTTLVVGAVSETKDAQGLNSLIRAGAAYIFDYNGTEWVETQKLVASDRNTEDEFGVSVSISGDNLVVGAYLEDEDADNNNTVTNSGSAYIFTNNSGTWTEAKKIVSADRSSDDFFGYTVSISNNYVVVGAYFEDEDELGINTINGAGATYVYKYDRNDWVLQQKLIASDREFGARFGTAVSISNNRLAVGAIFEDKDESSTNTFNNAGAVYIFSLINDIWLETQKIVSSDRAAEDLLGYATAISGNNLISSATNEDEDASGGNTLAEAGSAYIFELTCNTTTSSTLDTTVCNSYTSPSGKYEWTTNGNYSDTILNTIGCDSIIDITLTVNTINAIIINNAPTLLANTNGASYIWIDCNNNQPINGENSQNFTPSISGDYAVIITENGCIDTSACENVTIVGVNNSPNNLGYKIYPNPSNNGSVTIELNEQYKSIFVSVYDITGKSIKKQNYNLTSNITLNIDSTPGVYFINLIVEKLSPNTIKIILQ